MKQILLYLGMVILLAATPDFQQKTYPCNLTITQWQQVIGGIQSSQLPAQQANELVAIISQQINKQLADTVNPKK